MTESTEERVCEKHGAYTSRALPLVVGMRRAFWSRCQKCECERDEQERAKQAAAEQAAHEHRRQTLLDCSGLAGRFEQVSFDTFQATTEKQRAALSVCMQFAQNVQFGGGAALWLIGPTGTGKTHLGSAIVRYVIEERDTPARIYSARAIVRMLRATWRNNGTDRERWGQQSEEALIDEIGSTPLLVLDEVGVGFGSDTEQVQLLDIIDARYVQRRPTVVLSNLPREGVRQALGDRAFDRLREEAKVLVLDGPSHRGGQR